jgi:hypothetical protein
MSIEITQEMAKLAERARVKSLHEITAYGSAGVDERHDMAMRAALTAVAPLMQAKVPEGYVLVPINPTFLQLAKGGHVASEWWNDNAPIGEGAYQLGTKGIYEAMLAAAPEVQS